ncbi:hypothetical protein LA20533_04765 [Amylolactobacillus amylophilus DSM 20533 = JCM 1125]|uniref:Uncharacterized protein n=1 Tax=Amylolactobacillus amylophilus DSM 20533 = JCM 1125 TaxID=1423721 RepID=A0A1L6XCA6_9LACO|nr:hypothetical protein LA20533_04765 [Amylolactobacillus amylophilus DSM 20533 = JCM 1125]
MTKRIEKIAKIYRWVNPIWVFLMIILRNKIFTISSLVIQFLLLVVLFFFYRRYKSTNQEDNHYTRKPVDGLVSGIVVFIVLFTIGAISLLRWV